jgi:hypothetical protein
MILVQREFERNEGFKQLWNWRPELGHCIAPDEPTYPAWHLARPF